MAALMGERVICWFLIAFTQQCLNFHQLLQTNKVKTTTTTKTLSSLELDASSKENI